MFGNSTVGIVAHVLVLTLQKIKLLLELLILPFIFFDIPFNLPLYWNDWGIFETSYGSTVFRMILLWIIFGSKFMMIGFSVTDTQLASPILNLLYLTILNTFIASLPLEPVDLFDFTRSIALVLGFLVFLHCSEIRVRILDLVFLIWAGSLFLIFLVLVVTVFTVVDLLDVDAVWSWLRLYLTPVIGVDHGNDGHIVITRITTST